MSIRLLFKYGMVSSFLAASFTTAMQKNAAIVLHGTTQQITLKEEYALQSTTIAALLSDVDKKDNELNRVFPVPFLDTALKLIEPYFKLAHEKNDAEIKARLQNHSQKELADIITAFNYLDLESIRGKALETLAHPLSRDENIYSCLENKQGSYDILLPLDMQHELAAKMIPLLPTPKAILLLYHLIDTNNNALPSQQLTDHATGLKSVCFTRSGTLLASAGNDNNIKIFNPKTATCLYTLKDHFNLINSVCFSPDSTILASASNDETVKLWDFKNEKCLSTLNNHTDCVNCVCFNANTVLASASDDETVRLWDMPTVRCLQTLNNKDFVTSACFNADGTVLAAACDERKIKLWDPKTATRTRKIKGHSGYLNCVCFNSDGILASASVDGAIKLWDLRTYECLDTLASHSSCVNSVCFNTEGTLLAAAYEDATVKMWDPKTAKIIHSQMAHTQSVNSVCFNPDGTALASASFDHTIRLWKLVDSPLQQRIDQKQIKPEQLALLSYKAHCIKRNITPSADDYPGISAIALPGEEQGMFGSLFKGND